MPQTYASAASSCARKVSGDWFRPTSPESPRSLLPLLIRHGRNRPVLRGEADDDRIARCGNPPTHRQLGQPRLKSKPFAHRGAVLLGGDLTRRQKCPENLVSPHAHCSSLHVGLIDAWLEEQP